ncbi:MAG: HD domain-containing protein [Opitutaceae bacterium]|nr:HD domain-containing protein [Opitutaceae bacterium]
MVPPHAIDTKNPSAVAEAAKAAFGSIGAQASFPFIAQLFSDVTDMFEGRYPGYQAIDMFYHDYEHTLQATVCLIHILEGHHRSGDAPKLRVRDWELALMSVLLHDCGYLKRSDDITGTGAKYTLIHERRSCEFARMFLPRRNVLPHEVEDVCSAIICTGPHSKISQVSFRREEARLMAFILVTADYLAQMSDANYVKKLPILIREFNEAYEFEQVPPEKRPYHELRELMQKTPGFWTNFVRPMLDFEAGGVHRYLTTAGRPNPYLDAVEANIAEIRRLVQEGAEKN